MYDYENRYFYYMFKLLSTKSIGIKCFVLTYFIIFVLKNIKIWQQ